MKDLSHINLSLNLEVLAKQIVEGFITGMHKSPYHGFSVEFAEHRLYNTGESTKHIDWRLYARTDKFFIKKFQEETNLRCQLIIDTSSSMYYPNFKNPTLHQPNKLLFSIYASAVLMNLLKRQRDAIGLSVFSNDVELHTPSRTTQRHHRLLYHELDKLIKLDAIKDSRNTDSTNAIHKIAEMLNRRSMVVIFTDMISDEEHLDKQFEAYKHLKYNQHEVILFYLNEPVTEINLDFENKPHKFIDVESGEVLKLNPLQYQRFYQQKTKSFLDNLKLKCLQYKIDFVDVDINKGFDQILSSYLLKRQKMF
jgi:uncharacterized protein (DUF58 family)